MVVTQHPAAAGQGVLVECAGLLILAQLAQVGGEPAGRGEGFGVVVAQHRRRRVRVSFWSWRACWCSPREPRVRPRRLAERSVYGVVLAQDSAAAGEGVVLELAGLLVLAQGPG